MQNIIDVKEVLFLWKSIFTLADMQLISKFNKGISFLLCVFDILWVVSLKDEKGVTIINAFRKILDDSKRKPNKTWIDKDSEFYNRSMKSWSEDNNIKIYSTHNEGKSVVAERFIRTLKIRASKYVTLISKSEYIDKLDGIVNEYNNTYHRTIKVKPVDVKNDTYINIDREVNDKDPKFQVDDHVRISK